PRRLVAGGYRPVRPPVRPLRHRLRTAPPAARKGIADRPNIPSPLGEKVPEGRMRGIARPPNLPSLPPHPICTPPLSLIPLFELWAWPMTHPAFAILMGGTLTPTERLGQQLAGTHVIA